MDDLKTERDTLLNLLNDIINARGQKSRKLAIDRARDMITPKKDLSNKSWAEEAMTWLKEGW